MMQSRNSLVQWYGHYFELLKIHNITKKVKMNADCIVNVILRSNKDSDWNSSEVDNYGEEESSFRVDRLSMEQDGKYDRQI